MTFAQVILASLALASPTACAPADQPIGDSQQAVQLTIQQLLLDPEPWDGKWVKLVGWTDSEHAVLAPSPDDLFAGIGLEPAKHYRNRAFGTGPHDMLAPVVVTGRVDLSCIKWFKQSAPGISYSEIRQGPPVFSALDHAPPPDGSLGFCVFMIAPYLTNVVIENAKAAQ